MVDDEVTPVLVAIVDLEGAVCVGVGMEAEVAGGTYVCPKHASTEP